MKLYRFEFEYERETHHKFIYDGLTIADTPTEAEDNAFFYIKGKGYLMSKVYNFALKEMESTQIISSRLKFEEETK